LRNVNVVEAREEAFAAKESIALINDVEKPTAENVALLFCLGLEEAEDQLLLAEGVCAGNTKVLCQLGKIFSRLVFEFSDIHIGLRMMVWVDAS
jgi:hypothetical protein